MKVLSWHPTDRTSTLGFRFSGKPSFLNTSKPSTNLLMCKCCHTALIKLLFRMLYFIFIGKTNSTLVYYFHNFLMLLRVTPLYFSLCPSSEWRPTPAAPAWTNTTSQQPRTWRALLFAALPPPSRSPTCPPPANAARGPNTSWSSKASKTTTTHWRAHCKGLLLSTDFCLHGYWVTKSCNFFFFF